MYAQELFQKYFPWHYYTLEGKKITGLIKFICKETPYTSKATGANYIEFKTDKNSKKTKLTTNDISGFVTKQDSFTIVKDLEFKDFFSFRLNQEFVEVAESGRLNLYYYYAMRGSGQQYVRTKTSYAFIGKERNNIYLPRTKYKDVLLNLIQDYPELHNEVSNLPEKSMDIKDIVSKYNAHFN